MKKVPQPDPSMIDYFFVDVSTEQRESMKNSKEQLSLFKEIKRYVEKGDRDAAIGSLKNIINRPGLESWQYNEAFNFLNKLFAFSEKYFELYGIRFESRN
jgi:hypothetical protein